MQPLPPEELQRLVQEAAERGTKQALVQMGMNMDEPIEAQKDMAFLRAQRKASENMGTVIRRTVLVAALTGLLTIAWLGIQAAIHTPVK
jgi:2-iminoacetate synthase ThiH